MFKRPTLFIIGAGASAEVRIPPGKELARIIAEKMDIRYERMDKFVGQGDENLFQHITYHHRQYYAQFHNAAWLIRDGIGFAQSIDDFLDQHRTNEFVNLYGKAAIVKTVLEAEAASNIYLPPDAISEPFRPTQFTDTWFVKFMYVLARNVPRESAPQIFNNVSFIIFNYDRCIEHFLRHALRSVYGIPYNDACGIVDNLHIIHPYGVIEQVPFGAPRANYVDLASRLYTYTEQIGNAELQSRLSDELHRAGRIVFLGFAFHDQNVQLLKPATGIDAKRIYGTAFGMSDSDVRVTIHQLADFFNPDVHPAGRLNLIKLENKLRGADLFDYYAKSLSGAD
jgi:hypothetical protein